MDIEREKAENSISPVNTRRTWIWLFSIVCGFNVADFHQSDIDFFFCFAQFSCSSYSGHVCSLYFSLTFCLANETECNQKKKTESKKKSLKIQECAIVVDCLSNQKSCTIFPLTLSFCAFFVHAVATQCRNCSPANIIGQTATTLYSPKFVFRREQIFFHSLINLTFFFVFQPQIQRVFLCSGCKSSVHLHFTDPRQVRNFKHL